MQGANGTQTESIDKDKHALLSTIGRVSALGMRRRPLEIYYMCTQTCIGPSTGRGTPFASSFRNILRSFEVISWVSALWVAARHLCCTPRFRKIFHWKAFRVYRLEATISLSRQWVLFALTLKSL
jgi:hypothetical protein